MPNWSDVLGEITALAQKSPMDEVRRKYLSQLSNHTGRNVITYYSGWLQHGGAEVRHLTQMTDDDKNGLMTAINGLDVSKGLDLILHTCVVILPRWSRSGII